MKKRFAIILVYVLFACVNMHAQSWDTKTDAPDSLKPEETKGVLQVKGRFLYDCGGKRIILRGIEDFIDNHVDEIAKTGANAYRIVYTTDAARLELVLQNAICENNMIVSVASARAYNETAWWNKPDIKEVLKKYESHIVLHAYQEAPYDGDLPGSDERWLAESVKLVKEIRGYGYVCPLEILADSWGQNVKVLLKHGRKVIDSDPERNIILGYQVYSNTRLDAPNKMTIETALDAVEKSGLPILVGACAFTDKDCKQLYGSPADGWKRVWRGAFDHRIGCYYWCWSGSPSWLPSCDALSTDGYYGHWSKYGEEICGDNEYSISVTSVKSSRTIGNWPPVRIKKIADCVIDKSKGKIDNYINVKEYFIDHEDGAKMVYSLPGMGRAGAVSAKIDADGFLDLNVADESFGIFRITIIATDSGGKQASGGFNVRIPDPDRKNIALKKSAAVSSVKDGLNGANMTDGNFSTRWGSEWKGDQWVILDLGGLYPIDAFTLNWEAAFAVSYEILVSCDNANWSSVYAESNGDGEIDEFAIAPVTARYVKLSARRPATPWGFSIWELAVYEKKTKR